MNASKRVDASAKARDLPEDVRVHLHELGLEPDAPSESRLLARTIPPPPHRQVVAVASGTPPGGTPSASRGGRAIPKPPVRDASSEAPKARAPGLSWDDEESTTHVYVRDVEEAALRAEEAFEASSLVPAADDAPLVALDLSPRFGRSAFSADEGTSTSRMPPVDLEVLLMLVRAQAVRIEGAASGEASDGGEDDPSGSTESITLCELEEFRRSLGEVMPDLGHPAVAFSQQWPITSAPIEGARAGSGTAASAPSPAGSGPGVARASVEDPSAVPTREMRVRKTPPPSSASNGKPSAATTTNAASRPRLFKWLSWFSEPSSP